MDLWTEQEAADAMGVSRETMERVRDLLQEGQHWLRKKGGAVFYRPEGLRAAAGHMGLPEEDAPRKKGESVHEMAVVTEVPCLNRRLLLAKWMPSGETIRVMVRLNVNFVKDHALDPKDLRPASQGEGVFDYVGRYPVQRGAPVWREAR